MIRVPLLAITLLCVIGCGGLPAPAQYDHAMLRPYLGKSAAEVKDAFGPPTSMDASPNGETTFVYDSADDGLRFQLDAEGKVTSITYDNALVSPAAPE